MDQFLHHVLDLGVSPEECVGKGFDADFVTAVMSWIRGNKFKRMLPPIAKLSDRAEGDDVL